MTRHHDRLALDALRMIQRHDSESHYNDALQVAAEPLILSLVDGRNEFGGLDFMVLVRYIFLDQNKEASKAISRGRFQLGKIEVVRVCKQSVTSRLGEDDFGFAWPNDD